MGVFFSQSLKAVRRNPYFINCGYVEKPQILRMANYKFRNLVFLPIQLDQKIIVDRMLHLAFCGHAVPVIEHLSLCMSQGSMDHSLIRYFVHEVSMVALRVHISTL